METRRDFIKKAISLSGLATLSGVVPECVQRAFAIAPDPGTSYLDAEHIVILMQENRSFDHALGTLQGVRGFNDPRAVRLANGSSVFLQTGAANQTYVPWRLDIKDTRATWLGSLPHSRESQLDAWNGGNYNNWIDAKTSNEAKYVKLPLTMGHYTRQDLPFYYALADAFTVCDHNFCGAMTSTFPNRLLFWTGTIRENARAKANIRNYDLELGNSHWMTFPERLQQSSIPWKVYQNDLGSFGALSDEQNLWLGNLGCNALEYFAQYHLKFSPQYMGHLQFQIDLLAADIRELKSQTASASPSDKKPLRIKLEGKKKKLNGLMQDREAEQNALGKLPHKARKLHERAFVTNAANPGYRDLATLDYHDGAELGQISVPKGDVLYQFRADVHAGQLPTISWLVAPQHFSDHPASPWYGAWYVSEVMDILTKNPGIWKKTIFILTYDENDGYFDHMPPFVTADPRRKQTGGASTGIDLELEYIYADEELVHGTPEDQVRTGPIGLGYRVPMIIASPWSRGGWVNSQLFDHTSTIQFLEEFVKHKFNLKLQESNISAWRRAICGNLTSAFRAYDGQEPSLPFLDRNRFVESIQRARSKEIPSNYRHLTPEEIARANHDLRASALIPIQESGVRHACAIPYEIYADGHLSADRQNFEIEMRAANIIFGDRAVGSPFNVYLYRTKHSSAIKTCCFTEVNMMVATYVVKPGEILNESFPLSLFTKDAYEIAVHGPNGFFRTFSGDTNDPFIEVACRYQADQHGNRSLSGNLEFHIEHKGGNYSCIVEIADNSYAAELNRKTIGIAHSKIVTTHDLSKQYNWYDFSIRVAGCNGFEKRYAGHVENGEPSYTDPLMGGVLQGLSVNEAVATADRWDTCQD